MYMNVVIVVDPFTAHRGLVCDDFVFSASRIDLRYVVVVCYRRPGLSGYGDFSLRPP